MLPDSTEMNALSMGLGVIKKGPSKRQLSDRKDMIEAIYIIVLVYKTFLKHPQSTASNNPLLRAQTQKKSLL